MSLNFQKYTKASKMTDFFYEVVYIWLNLSNNQLFIIGGIIL